MAKILVIDADRMMSRLLDLLLSRDGHEVTVKNDGPGGIDSFCLSDPELTIMGLNLGDMSGVDALKHMRGVKPRASIIVLVGESNYEEIQQVRRLGATRLLCNDSSLEELRESVQNGCGTLKRNVPVRCTNARRMLTKR